MNPRFSLRTVTRISSLLAVMWVGGTSLWGQEHADLVPVEAANPADFGEEPSGFLFFPRGGEDAAASAEFSSSSALEATVPEEDLSPERYLGEGPRLSEEDLDYADRMGQGGTPVQYSTDEFSNENDHTGGWRDSSVQRPDAVSLEEQPWVEWHKITVQAQTLPTAEEGLGITSLDVRGTLKFARLPFMFVTPRAAWHFLDGPPQTDLPPRLFDFSLDTTIYLPLNDRWTIQAGVSPGIYTDLKSTENAFRMTGRGLVFYRWSPQLQVAGGFVYLGRKDIIALPAIGAVYTPSDDVKVELMFPKPRAAYRYHNDLDRERWVYLSGELGGGTWAIERSSGANDLATYRDFQLLLGIEHKEPDAVNWQMEGGFVFSRKVEYESGIGDSELPATAVLRLVLTF